MYFVGSRNFVRAVNATSGELLWQYDPKVAKHAGDRLRVSFLHGSRGVALWNDKVYFGTADGRLIALDATTGARGVERDDRRSGARALHHRRAEGLQRQSPDRQRRHRERSGPRLRHGLRRRDRQAGVALLHRAGQSGRRVREAGDGDGRKDLDRRVVEDTAAAATRGTASRTTRNSTRSTSAPATARRGTRRFAAPAAATTSSSARSSRSIPTPASTAGTTRRRPAKPGTTTRTWTSCSPISRSTAARSRR